MDKEYIEYLKSVIDSQQNEITTLKLARNAPTELESNLNTALLKITVLEQEIISLKQLKDETELLVEIEAKDKLIKHLQTVLDKQGAKYDWLSKQSIEHSRRQRKEAEKLLRDKNSLIDQVRKVYNKAQAEIAELKRLKTPNTLIAEIANLNNKVRDLLEKPNE